MSAEPTMLRAALAYAERLKWHVLPLHTPTAGGCSCENPACGSPGKHPRLKGPAGGGHTATTDAEFIRRWWGAWPMANIGTATGAASGFFVVDVDPRHGGEDSLAELEARHGRLPGTVEQLTGGGGRHLLFRHPGFPIQNKVSIAGGLDARGDGGLVVAAPSLHPSGRRYAWELSSRPGEAAIAEAPAWLLEMLGTGAAADRPQATAPEEWRRLAAGVEEGERNQSVARLAGHLLRRYVDPYVVLDLVQAWNEARCRPPLDRFETARTVRSVAAAEARRRGGDRRG